MIGKMGHTIVNILVRGIIGISMIFLINQIFEFQGISVLVGINLCTFLTTGTLGIPGVGLLYGIMFYQVL